MDSSLPSVFITFSFLLLASILIPPAAASDGDRELLDRFEQWAVEFGRRYENADEKAARFEAFKSNLQFIETFNSNGSRKFSLGLNCFADLTTEEFNRMIGSGSNTAGEFPPVQTVREGFRYKNMSLIDLPVAVDWRVSGTVTPVKDQGACGACSVFASVATVESLHKIITGQLVRLSEQEVLDCEPRNACKGAFPEVYYRFIQKRGLAAEADYPPYRGVDTNSCDESSASKVTASITGFVRVPINDEDEMMRAVANQPIYVHIIVGSPEFKLFTGDGVFNGDCGTTTHAVMIIGYGTQIDGTKYWLIKNSWGTRWGNGGFGKIARQTGAAVGVCNIATYPLYPNVWHPKL